ncbi:MAG: hypothetical protein HOE70_02345 [Flavobacteriaceae bacterium]|nr:hypothetical protein [Flavobacteriaceae bacterium]MBT4415388.1 hypothetical protein [Flavobacteriaceae bacterium]
MALSKKEISILIEIVFSIVFAFIFLPYFYENQDNNLILMDDLIGKIIEILIFTVIYFSVAYSLLEFVFKKKETKDERDDMINSKSYKLGYLLYEFSLFIFIGYVCSKFQNKELLNLTGNQELYNNFNLTDAGVVFLILILLAFISIVKSLYQFYLYRTV